MKTPEYDDIMRAPVPPGFVSIEEWMEKALDPRWDANDEAWNDWNFELLGDEELLRRFHDAAMELEAQAFQLTDAGEIVPRQFTEEELTRARALRNFWKAYCEVYLRHELRKVVQALAAEEKLQ